MTRSITRNQEIYRDLIKPEHGLFHQAWWWDIQCGPNRWIPLIGKRNHGVHWIWPIRIHRKWGINCITPPQFTYDSAPLWFDTTDQIAWMYIMSDYVKSKAGFTRIKVRQPSPEWPSFWSGKQRRRQIIDATKSEDELFGRCTKSKRKQIRRGAKRLPGWYKTSLEEVLICFSDFQTEFERDIDSLKNLSKLDASPVELMCVLQENRQGIVIAGFIMLSYSGVLYTLASSRDSDSPNFTMAHLIWQVIMLAKAQGISTIDLCGSDLKGVRRFNLEMGAEEKLYEQYTLYNNQLIKALAMISSWRT